MISVFILVALCIIGFLAATISGAAGFGGALLLLPILAQLVGIQTAIPVLTLGQVFGNASRVWFGRRELRWKPILLFLATSIPFTLVGSLLFTIAPATLIKRTVGGLLLLVVVYRHTPLQKVTLGNSGMLLGGSLTGFVSGIAGSAGPLGAAFFLGLELPATAYIASEAMTALTMHLVKTAVYQRFGGIGLEALTYGLVLGLAMIGGSWAGKKIAQRLPKQVFLLTVEVLLIVSGIQMLFFS